MIRARGRRSAGRTLALATAALAASAAAGEARAAVTRFEAKADSYVSAASPRGSFGSARVLQVRGRPMARSYLRFDVGGLPGSVTNLTLELVPRTSSPAGLIVQAAARGLTERGTRLRNAPRPQGRAITSGALRAGVTLKIDVTKLVSGEGSVTFVLTSRSRRLIKVASREGPAAARPRLLVTTNAAPVCSAITLSAVEDTPALRTPECADADGDALSLSVLTQPSKGSASVVGANLQYVPSANANGSDSFVIRATDGRTASPTATVTVSVRAVNDAPTCAERALTIPEDGSGAVAPSCSDVDGDALTYSILSQAVKGTASAVGAELRYVPDTDTFGTDTFTYRARDGALPSDATTVSVTITPVNDAPVAQNQNLTTSEDTPRAVTLGATDPESASLTYSTVSDPSHGTLTGTPPNLTYTPAAEYNGPDSFTFKARDASLDSNGATVSFAVTEVNDAPTAAGDSRTVLEDGTLVFQASDLVVNDATGPPNEAGQALTVISVQSSVNGAVVLSSGGNVTFTPAANFAGVATFTYTARDNGTTASLADPKSATGTVNVTVTPVNDPPAAANDSYSTPEGTTLNVGAPGLLGNDTDIDTAAASLSASKVSNPAHGTATVNANGSFIYTPAAGYSGPDLFTYKVNDGALNSNAATVALDVGSVNDAPVAQGQNVTTAEDTAKTITLVATDVDSSSLAYSVLVVPAHGLLSGTAPNLTYTPAANYNGSDSFTFKANDGALDSNIATVAITVTAVNDAPVCTPLTLTVAEDADGSVAGACSDPEGQPVTYSLVSDPAKGLAWEESGELHYVTFANQTGEDTFTYGATDGTASGTASVTVTITSVNDAPEALPQLVRTAVNTSKTVTLEGYDEEGDALVYTIESLPAHGLLYKGNLATGTPIAAASLPVRLAGDVVTYRPDTGYTGADMFEFTAFDGTESGIAADIEIDVRGVNHAPVCTTQSVSVDEDSDFWVAVCSDQDGDDMTFTRTGPTHGTLEIFEDGQFNYVPHANYNGPDSFSVSAKDTSNASSGTAVVTITVVPVNDEPTCRIVLLTTPEDTASTVLPDCEDPDGQPMTYSIVGAAAKGAASVTATGGLRYVPDANENGADSFTYAASDGTLTSEAARVDVQVSPVNDRPVCRQVAIATRVGVQGTAFPDCEDADGDTLSYSIVAQPAAGVASFSTGLLRYEPSTAGSYSFTYHAKDALIFSVAATVSVTVTS